ncbi:MAG: GTPase Era [Bacteroidia bacterium]|nr:GTPase Era [Bacteroidia bacterium]MCZ2247329.1 GTPase Era [Bacteroidia bacterium]
MNHRAGFVNIIGKPNAGKSTLMNILVGERLSIITPKAQTTRHRILGIVNEEDYQIVYSDTPGILTPHYKMHEAMMKFVYTALADADLLLFIVDVAGKEPVEEEVLKEINKSKTGLILILNKIDLVSSTDLEEISKYWAGVFPQAEIIPISALEQFNIEYLKKRIVAQLPISPPYYDKEQLTDKPEKFFVSETIREKIFLNYEKEVPYNCEVYVESFKDSPEIIKIRSIIFVSRDSQKGIIIGHKGAGLKRVGTQARIELEKFFGKKIFLELFVKVKKDWRNNNYMLKQFGYEE